MPESNDAPAPFFALRAHPDPILERRWRHDRSARGGVVSAQLAGSAST